MTLMILALSLLITAGCAEGAPDDSGHHDDDSGISGNPTEMETDGGTYKVYYSPNPSPIPYNEYFSLTLMVHDAQDTTVMLTDVSLEVDASMPEHGHGMNTEPTVTKTEDGYFTAEGMLFHMQGYWEIAAIVTGDNGAETATFPFTCCE